MKQTCEIAALQGHVEKTLLAIPPGRRPKMMLTFNLSNRTEVLLKSVIEFGVGDRLEVTGVNSPSRGGKATFAHTRVIPQSPFI